MKTVVIVHGWDGKPDEAWFPWLTKELQSRGFRVIAPQLPDNANPRIYNWVPALAAAIGIPDKDTYFVGHSMGCQTVARYLETLPKDVKVGGAVFVGGFFKHLSGIDENGKETEDHWLAAPPDFSKIKSHLSRNVAVFSDDDPWVPLDNQDDFRDQLGSEIIIEHQKGHYNNDSGTVELPVVLEKLLEMSKS